MIFDLLFYILHVHGIDRLFDNVPMYYYICIYFNYNSLQAMEDLCSIQDFHFPFQVVLLDLFEK